MESGSRPIGACWGPRSATSAATPLMPVWCNHQSDLMPGVQDRRAAEEAAVVAHDRAPEAGKAKSQCPATMSHEIRTRRTL